MVLGVGRSDGVGLGVAVLVAVPVVVCVGDAVGEWDHMTACDARL